MKNKFLCTTNANRYNAPACRWVKIDERNCIEGETPVEDFGMYFLTEIECTPEEAMQVFYALMIEEEGEFDYRGDPVTDKPEDELKTETSRAIYQAITNQ
jgi:hypothetical protein